jgi:hypothetical protein
MVFWTFGLGVEITLDWTPQDCFNTSVSEGHSNYLLYEDLE